jgi:predicted DCC family thiol-disulfide oxidoreductase YuxK
MTTGADAPTVLVYDGDCGFCTRAVNWLTRRAAPGLVARPYQGEDLRLYGLDETRCAHEVIYVGRGGRLYGGVLGFAALLRDHGRGGWRVPGALLPLPPLRWAALACYRLIARNRHRMPGGTAACAVPRP